MQHEKNKTLEIYSEKLGKTMTISETSDGNRGYIVEDIDSSMVGWTHNGWNNDNGGAGW